MASRKHPFITVSHVYEKTLKNTMSEQECEAELEKLKAEYKRRCPDVYFLFELCNTATCKKN